MLVAMSKRAGKAVQSQRVSCENYALCDTLFSPHSYIETALHSVCQAKPSKEEIDPAGDIQRSLRKIKRKVAEMRYTGSSTLCRIDKAKGQLLNKAAICTSMKKALQQDAP